MRLRNGIIAFVGRHSQKLTPEQYDQQTRQRTFATMVSIVLIDIIVFMQLSWFGFVVQSISIIVLVLWQEFANRRDRHRTDWSKVGQAHT